MGHVPHLYVAGPWQGDEIPLPPDQLHHVHKVLRLRPGTPLSYTDGEGLAGRGSFTGGAIERGDEAFAERLVPELSVAAVPIRDKQRSRFLVEKLAELGVAELRWIASKYGQASPPPKAEQWSLQALEQSRSSWRMRITRSGIEDLPEPVVVADPSGGAWPAAAVRTIAIGPEGGWADSDLPDAWPRVSLGPTVLRTETAGVVAVSQAFSGNQLRHDQ